jgi:hypothetical protein
MLAALLLPLLLPQSPADSFESLAVRVDSSRHEVVITTRPFDLPDMSGMHDHSQSHDTPVYKFDWPVDGWFRGFRVRVFDAEGNALPRRLMHHLIMINYARRQLVYRAAERLWGAGVETGNFSLPKTIGVPLSTGTSLGMYIAWHNSMGHDLQGVRLEIAMQWTPKNQLPAPVDVLPLYFDVNLKVGGANEFDIPPGHFEKVYEFTVPVEGRILGVSGHLHDYGREVRLEDAESGKVLTRVEARVRPDGTLQGMERRLFGVSGEGLKLKGGHRYRIVAVYDNPTPDTLVKGAMGSLVGIFTPRDVRDWPRVEPDDTLFQSDLRFLSRRGRGMMMQMHHEAAAPDTGQQGMTMPMPHEAAAADSSHEHSHD